MKVLKNPFGQSQVIQFVLFFLMGIAIFTTIGNYFRVQSELLRNDVSVYSVEMINSYLSSVAIASVDTCKECNIVENKIRISETTFGYFLEATLSSNGLTISTVPSKFEYTSSVNNLNESISFVSGSAPSVQPINLTYDRNQNKLEIR